MAASQSRSRLRRRSGRVVGPWQQAWGLRALSDVSEQIDASPVRSAGDQLGLIAIKPPARATLNSNAGSSRRSPVTAAGSDDYWTRWRSWFAITTGGSWLPSKR